MVTLCGLFLYSTSGVLGSSLWALIAGIVVGNIIPNRTNFKSGIKFSEAKLLAVGISLMGFGLQVSILTSMGMTSVAIVVAAAVLAIILAEGIGRILGFEKGPRLLVGVGTAICGSSAIAACAPFLTKKEEEIATSVGVVNLMGTLGIVALPLLFTSMALSTEQGSLLVGTTLQAVGHVVAAGYAINDPVGELATIVKMGRIALLIPLLIVLSVTTQAERKSKGSLPIFIWGFIGTAMLASFELLPAQVIANGQQAGKFAITGALAAIGLSINIKDFVTTGSRLLILGAAVSVVHVAIVLSLIWAFV